MFRKSVWDIFPCIATLRRSKEAKEAPKLMIIGPAILAAFCIGLGVFSLQIFGFLGFLLPTSQHALHRGNNCWLLRAHLCALREVANRRERIAETWGCGFPTQTSKMEYTASGFSEPIVTILKSIFRTQKKSERNFYDDKNVIFKDGKAEIHLLKFFEERLLPASRRFHPKNIPKSQQYPAGRR